MDKRVVIVLAVFVLFFGGMAWREVSHGHGPSGFAWILAAIFMNSITLISSRSSRREARSVHRVSNRLRG